ncbi:MAG: hypothetical protein ABFS37_12795, partial [Acidobacteriota bacterium]
MKRMKHNLLSIVWLVLSAAGMSQASEPLVGLVFPAGAGDGRYALVDEDYGAFRWIVVAEGDLAALPDLDRARQV